MLLELFKTSPIPDDQLLNNLGLYSRSSLTARLLHYYELYDLLLSSTGIILIYGFGYGNAIISFLSLRAILEPYNYSRKIIGFESLKNSSELPYYSKNGDNFTSDKYEYFSQSRDYIDFLKQIIDFHEDENIMSHIPKVEVYYNDPVQDSKTTLKACKDLKISLVYFDRVFVENIVDVLHELKPYVDNDTVICPSTINSYIPTGELDACREVLGKNLQITKSKFIPDKAYIKIN
ncbi:MAG: hypothetical protein RBR35_01165 [Salinivirgaceae bacterium]|nr:hypothetical protein [Salinivirgaceae bacterium]